MKNKLGFLDFSNTKDKCTEDIPFNVDYIIKELLEFGNFHKNNLKTMKTKQTSSTNFLEVNNDTTEIYVPDEYKKDSSENIQSPVNSKSRSDFVRKDRRMVC